MKYYLRHLGDYARDAGYLPMLEHGAYTLLLDWSYANEKPIPKELAYNICRAVTRAEKLAVQRVLEQFFLWDAQSGWRHKRVEREIERTNEKSNKARQSINLRWAKVKQEREKASIRSYYERITNDIQPKDPITPIPKDPITRDSKLVPIQTLLTRVGKGKDNG